MDVRSEFLLPASEGPRGEINVEVVPESVRIPNLMAVAESKSQIMCETFNKTGLVGLLVLLKNNSPFR